MLLYASNSRYRLHLPLLRDSHCRRWYSPTEDECTAATIRGVYMFHASGYNIVSGVPLPKAIIETVVFDGLGNVTTPAVSVSINGTLLQPPQGNPGVYTVDADCTGTLTFADGPRFDLQITPNGKQINMLQTNPNTVMQGTAQRVSRAAG